MKKIEKKNLRSSVEDLLKNFRNLKLSMRMPHDRINLKSLVSSELLNDGDKFQAKLASERVFEGELKLFGKYTVLLQHKDKEKGIDIQEKNPEDFITSIGKAFELVES